MEGKKTSNYSPSGFYALCSMFIHCLVAEINDLIEGHSFTLSLFAVTFQCFMKIKKKTLCTVLLIC